MQLFFNKQECKQRQHEFYLADKTYVDDSLFVEKIYVKPSHELFNQLTELSFLAKNLYNSTLYVYRQNYFDYKKLIQPIYDSYQEKLKSKISVFSEKLAQLKNKKEILQLKQSHNKEIEQLKAERKEKTQAKLKEENFNFIDYFAINQRFVDSKQPDYYHEKLNAHTAQQIMRTVQQNMNAYLALVKKKNSNDFNHKISLSKYLDKEEGLFVVPYSNQRIVKSTFMKDGLIHLSNTNIKINHPKFDSLEKFNCIKQVRIVPQAKIKSKNQYFTIEIVRSLFEEEKANILALTEKNQANKAIVRQIIHSPKLDEDNNLIIKTFEVSKRGRKLTDETGNKIIEKNVITKQIFDQTETYQANLDTINPVGLDVNLNQLAIAYFDKTLQQEKSFLISLKHVKSINWQYNKKLAKFQSILDGLKNQLNELKGRGQKTQNTQQEAIDYLKINIDKIKNKIRKLTTKRNKQIDVALHKISKKLVDKLSLFSINTLIIGKNKEWKQEINLGKCNNQNFVQIPFARLLDKILYKANKAGIHVIFTEESYTSKTSFFDKEELLAYYNLKNKFQPQFIGKRIQRGLFRSPNRKSLFHADVNAAFNIMRKVLDDYVYQLIDVTSLSHSGAVKKMEFKLFR